jgi:uncharacterized DUF497 family protein
MAMTVVRFTWNPAKAEANRRKHGVHFEDAARVFQDPLHLTVQDRIEDGEYRWQTIGQIHGVVVLLVAHTVNESRDAGDVEIRVISARKATRSERKRYEDESR